MSWTLTHLSSWCTASSCLFKFWIWQSFYKQSCFSSQILSIRILFQSFRKVLFGSNPFGRVWIEFEMFEFIWATLPGTVLPRPAYRRPVISRPLSPTLSHTPPLPAGLDVPRPRLSATSPAPLRPPLCASPPPPRARAAASDSAARSHSDYAPAPPHSLSPCVTARDRTPPFPLPFAHAPPSRQKRHRPPPHSPFAPIPFLPELELFASDLK
jgi:hypothetical protein